MNVVRYMCRATQIIFLLCYSKFILGIFPLKNSKIPQNEADKIGRRREKRRQPEIVSKEKRIGDLTSFIKGRSIYLRGDE